jgi:hypothetical protein
MRKLIDRIMPYVRRTVRALSGFGSAEWGSAEHMFGRSG